MSHHQVQLAVCRFVDLVDGADIRMVERRSGLGFEHEPLVGEAVACEVRRQYLERHLAIESRIAGLIHDSHAAATDAGNDFVRAESSASFKHHQLPCS